MKEFKLKVSTLVSAWVDQEVIITAESEEQAKEIIAGHIEEVEHSFGGFALMEDSAEIEVVNTELNIDSCVQCGDELRIYVSGIDNDFEYEQ